MKEFVFNPLVDKHPMGSCYKNSKVTYKLKVSKSLNFLDAFFVVHKDYQQDKYYKMQTDLIDERYVHLSCEISFKSSGHFWYHFEVKTKTGNYNLRRLDNLDCSCESDLSDYLQFVYDKKSQISSNFNSGAIYHIFVDRFNKVGKVKARAGLNLVDDWAYPVMKEYNQNNERVNINCYGGNLKGVTSKLEYLKKLNVRTIYLSPIFEANSSHKYNVADYLKVDSMFGDFNDLEELIVKAKDYGIKIIIDGVFNHTGSDSVYFNKLGRYNSVGAYQSKDSKYFSWYDFYDFPDSYSCWWGIKTLPQTNENSSFFDFITGDKGVIQKYMKLGLAGFRLDVADELSNKFLKAISSVVKKVDSKAIIVGEVWEDASQKISYGQRKEYFSGKLLDSVTNYPLKDGILEFVKYGSVDTFVNTISFILDQYPSEIQNNLMNILDTHDTLRAITYLGVEDLSKINVNEQYFLSCEERKKGKELLKIASLMQFTVMGIPTIFYGDEVGLEGTKDPFCRQTYPWGKEDKDLLSWYILLGELRSKKVFDGGEFILLYAKNSVIAYKRQKGKEKIIVVINLSNSNFEFILDTPMKNYFTKQKLSGGVNLNSGDYLVLTN